MEDLVIGHYRVIRKLGTGGMAEVYEARHNLMNSRVALKILLPEVSARAGSVRRFLLEAQATARIEHPGILHVHDIGRAPDGRAYLVMELLTGESLSRRLKRQRRLSLAEAVAVIRQLAGVVGAAHRHGIVHRDLKPENLFLVRDPEVPRGERVKVLDFGLAKLLENPLPMDTLTVQGTVLGTPAYMAPEQCLSAATVDHRADLYAIGCIFYACLCGRPPFGTGGVEVLLAHVGQPPTPPRLYDATIPPAIEEIILWLLAKSPAQRVPSCEALIAALDRVGTEVLAPGPYPGASWEDSGALTVPLERQNPDEVSEEKTQQLATQTLENVPLPPPESVPVLAEDVEILIQRARQRIAGTLPPPARAPSPMHEALVRPRTEPPPESLSRSLQADEYLSISVSMDGLSRPMTAARELQASPEQVHGPLDSWPEWATKAPRRRAPRRSSPTISDGEIERPARRTGRRNLLRSMAVIGCVGGLVAGALTTIDRYERARQEDAHQELPPRLLSAASSPAAGTVPSVTAKPVEAAQEPVPELDLRLAELDALLRQAEQTQAARDWEATRARLEELRVHPGYAKIDPERATRLAALVTRLEAGERRAGLAPVEAPARAVASGDASRGLEAIDSPHPPDHMN